MSSRLLVFDQMYSQTMYEYRKSEILFSVGILLNSYRVIISWNKIFYQLVLKENTTYTLHIMFLQP